MVLRARTVSRCHRSTAPSSSKHHRSPRHRQRQRCRASDPTEPLPRPGRDQPSRRRRRTVDVDGSSPVNRLGDPLRQRGIQVALGQVVYGQRALVPGEASIDDKPECQSPVIRRTNSDGEVSFTVVGREAQPEPVFFQADRADRRRSKRLQQLSRRSIRRPRVGWTRSASDWLSGSVQTGRCDRHRNRSPLLYQLSSRPEQKRESGKTVVNGGRGRP